MNNVIIALAMKAIITALPANPIAGPVRTKIDPPIIAAIPTIITSRRLKERIRWGSDGNCSDRDSRSRESDNVSNNAIKK